MNSINIGGDCWDIINDYKYQMEHTEKFSKCIEKISEIDYRIYRITEALVSSYRNGRAGTRYELHKNRITRMYGVAIDMSWEDVSTTLFWKKDIVYQGYINSKYEIDHM